MKRPYAPSPSACLGWRPREHLCWDKFCDDVVAMIYRQAGVTRPIPFQITNTVLEDQWNQLTFGDQELADLFLAAKKQFKAKLQLELATKPQGGKFGSPRSDWAAKADRSNWYHWKLASFMMSKQYSPAVVDDIDHESDEILARLPDPANTQDWKSYGLVVGAIQAGKTSNYAALIAKAADAGYRIIIVLSGMHNDLREQTQDRLDEIFTGYHSVRDQQKIERTPVGIHFLEDWIEDKAPQKGTISGEDFFATDHQFEARPWLFVVKKETHVLEKLASWIQNNLRARKNSPLLLIDDEADQASMNTAKIEAASESAGCEDEVAAAERKASIINARIRTIIKSFPRSAYVAYTASPFANIFADAGSTSKRLGTDLFPRDFIYPLRTPANYFGPEEYFDSDHEEEAALFKPMPEHELQAWFDEKNKKLTSGIPPTVFDCFCTFTLSAAIRAWRELRAGNKPNPDDPLKSSMLVHLNQRVELHKQLARQFWDLLKDARQSVRYEAIFSPFFKKLQESFDEQKRVTPVIKAARADLEPFNDWSLPDSFEELWPLAVETLQSMEILTVNGETHPERSPDDTPEISKSKRRLAPSVWVGGNKLSRGLTIPKLCMSVFLRRAQAADTLLQMGRWFGFRDGYSDLCRICTTSELAEKFKQISLSIGNLRQQISSMNGKELKPENYPIIVQSHPSMMLTSPNKMRTAKQAFTVFCGQSIENREFSVRHSVVVDNFAAAQDFAEALHGCGSLVYENRGADHPQTCLEMPNPWTQKNPTGQLWRSVPSNIVLKLLDEYKTLNQAKRGSDDDKMRMLEYIRSEVRAQRLLRWNVWIPMNFAKNRIADNYVPSSFNPVDRSDSFPEKNVSSATEALYLRSLRANYDKFCGVREDLLESAKAAASDPKKSSEVFLKVMQLAADEDASGGHPHEGYLSLYAISAKLFEKLPTLRTDGDLLYPLISYALWMPGQMSAEGLINATATSH